MSFNKHKVLLLVILVTMFILPLILTFLEDNFFNGEIISKEGYTGYDYTGKNKAISALDVSGVTYADDASGQPIVGTSGQMLFCVGGTIETDVSGYTITDSGSDLTGIEGHDPIKVYKCMDSSGVNAPLNAKCTGSFISDAANGSLVFKNTADDTGATFVKTAGTTGFIGPYDHAPMGISGDFVYPYSTSGSGDSLSYSIVNDTGYSNCNMYEGPSCYYTWLAEQGDASGAPPTDVSGEPMPDVSGVPQTDVSGVPQTDVSGVPQTETKGKRCIANFNAQVGDPLCCGQPGTVQLNDDICGKDAPYCAGYECGKTWGHCTNEVPSAQ